jgi:hypothetical protein
MVNYLNSLESTFSNGVATTMQDVVTFEQNYVQIIRKIDLVMNLTDGKILDTNLPRVYNLSATTQVSNSSKTGDNPPTTTFIELGDDYFTLNKATSMFNDLLRSDDYQIAFNTNTYGENGTFKVLNSNLFPDSGDTTFFFVMARILSDKNKKDEFINYVIKGNLVDINTPVKLRNKFEKIVDDLYDDYKKELKDEEKMFENLKKEKDYKNLTDGIEDTMYPKGKTRKFEYSTVPNPATEANQKTEILNLYKSINVNDDVTTYKGKIKFT